LALPLPLPCPDGGPLVAPVVGWAAPAADEFTYFPSQFAAPTGPVEDLPPQF